MYYRDADHRRLGGNAASIRTGILLILLTLVLSVTAKAQIATPSRDEATIACRNWLMETTRRYGNWSGSQNPRLLEAQTIAVADTTLGYLFRAEPGGSMIVPASFDLPTVLVYSETSQYQLDEGIAAMARDFIRGRLRALSTRSGTQMPRHRRQWESYLVDESEFLADLERKQLLPAEEGEALLDTNWDQGWPFNLDCPVGSNGPTAVGCVATAAAQIMYYHRWPPLGQGENSYDWDGDDSCDQYPDTPGQTLAESFADGYGWEFMANQYLYTPEGRAAVAELCFEIGVAVEMDFGSCGSGVPTSDMRDVYEGHFRYQDNIDRADRFWHTASDWFALIREDLEQDRPIHYRILRHSVVVDGWRFESGTGDMQYHVNYGHADSNTGWWDIDDIPGSDFPLINEYMLRNISPDIGSVSGLSPPDLNTPQPGVVVPGTMVGFDWEPVDGASGYTFALGNTCDSSMDEHQVGTSDITVDGLVRGETYYWRVKTNYGRGNSGPFGPCRSFTVEPDPIQHTSISINNLDANPQTILPYGTTVVSGNALYEDGSPVAVGNATISVQDGSTYTAPIVNGSFSRSCQGPGNDSQSTVARTISVTASDGVVTPGTGNVTIYVEGQGSTSYDLTTDIIYDYVGDDYSVQWWSKDAFRTTDEWVGLMAVFENMNGSGALDLQWECYRPNGEQYGTTAVWDEAIWLEWGWGWATWGWYIDGNSMSYHPGKYQMRFFVDNDLKATHNYVVAWDFVAHFLCTDYTEDFQPIGITSTFSPTDSHVIALNHFEYRAQELNYRTEFVAPGGSVYTTLTGQYEDDLGPHEWYGWSRDASPLQISGTPVRYLCGEWAVRYYVQNPTSGAWELKYTTGFVLVEHEPPSITVTPATDPAIAGQPILLSLSATDNNHLDQVIVHWNDGSDHQHTWNNINQSTFSTDFDIGTYADGQQITYWAETRDESGNEFTTAQQQLSVYVETVTPPTIPSGPTVLAPGEPAAYTTSGAACSAGHEVEYQFQWGDGTTSTWGEPTATKSYPTGGTYAITATARCLVNPTIVSAPSMPLLVAVDAGPPGSVSGPLATGAHEAVTLTWTDATDEDIQHYEIWRASWLGLDGLSAYPEYDDAGTAPPTRPADRTSAQQSEEWELIATVAPGIESYDDSGLEDRGVYYYEIMACDAVGRYGPPADTGISALSYILGDFGDLSGSDYDGIVGVPDLVDLSVAYGTIADDAAYDAEIDVGPTADHGPTGLPTTDDAINFEDLIIVAWNGSSYKSGSDEDLPDEVLISLQFDGNEMCVRLDEPASQLMALRIVRELPSQPPLRVTKGELIEAQGGFAFLANDDHGGVDIAIALIGGEGLAGTGELVSVELADEPDTGEFVITARSVGNEDLHVVVTETVELAPPVATRLVGNYPNPFNPTTTIRYELSTRETIKLDIYDVTGRHITRLVNEVAEPGRHEAQWHGRDRHGEPVSSGVYFCRLVGGDKIDTVKLQLVR